MANFTPQEIEVMLQEFFDVVGKRQYIGARYVPIFGRRGESSIDWDNSAPYEPLTIVLYQGNSFTSRTYVPEGVDILNTDYWANTGNYNAQVEAYRHEVIELQNNWSEWKADTEEDLSAWKTDTTDELSEWKTDTLEDFTEAIDDLPDIIPSNAFSETNTVKSYIDNKFGNQYSIDEMPGNTQIEKLRYALSNYQDFILVCGKITVDDSIDVGLIQRDLRRVILVDGFFEITDKPLFTSSTPDDMSSLGGSVPSFANCVFRNMNFTTKTATVGVCGNFHTIAPRYDSCKFIGCIAHNAPTHYVQSLYLNNCDLLYIHNDFVTAQCLYNLTMNACRVEYGDGKLFNLTRRGLLSICNGAITDCLIEGRGDTILTFEGTLEPLLVQGCYFENNAFPYFRMTSASSLGFRAESFFRYNYFNVADMTSSDKVWIYNGNDNRSNIVIENNCFEINQAPNTVVLTDFAVTQTARFHRNFTNYFSNDNLKLYSNAASPGVYGNVLGTSVIDNSNIVYTIPVTRTVLSWQLHRVFEITAYLNKLNQDSVVNQEIMHFRVAFIANGSNTNIQPVIFDLFKSDQNTNVTATLSDNAYNSRNVDLILTFSGFEPTKANVELFGNTNEFQSVIYSTQP